MTRGLAPWRSCADRRAFADGSGLFCTEIKSAPMSSSFFFWMIARGNEIVVRQIVVAAKKGIQPDALFVRQCCVVYEMREERLRRMKNTPPSPNAIKAYVDGSGTTDDVFDHSATAFGLPLICSAGSLKLYA